MKTKKIIAICAGVLAVLAVVVGLCFFFLGIKSIKQTPSFLKIEKVENDYCLITEFNGKYKYKFVLEQFVEDDYVVLQTVENNQNILKLSSCNIQIVAGAKYRFSVCFCTAGASGKFLEQPLMWQAASVLPSVEYSLMKTEGEVLSWQPVANASGYVVKLVDATGKVLQFSTQEAQLSLQSVPAGRFWMYVIASSQNDAFVSSAAGEGKELILQRSNQILSAERRGNSIVVSCTQKPEKFEIYADGVLKGTVVAREIGTTGSYILDGLNILLADVNSNPKLQVKACAQPYIQESNLFDVK